MNAREWLETLKEAVAKPSVRFTEHPVALRTYEIRDENRKRIREQGVNRGPNRAQLRSMGIRGPKRVRGMGLG